MKTLRKCNAFTHKFSGKRNSGAVEEFKSFWSMEYDPLIDLIRIFVHKTLGNDVKYYTYKHHFISRIFKYTNNDFRAEAFTHEATGANAKNYRHLDQTQADKILSAAILTPFAKTIDAILRGESISETETMSVVLVCPQEELSDASEKSSSEALLPMSKVIHHNAPTSNYKLTLLAMSTLNNYIKSERQYYRRENGMTENVSCSDVDDSDDNI